MKTGYRIVSRPKIEAPRRLRLRADGLRALQPRLDNPMEMAPEVIDLAAEKRLLDQRNKKAQ